MADYEIGQELFYREGRDLALRVNVLEDLSNKKTEAYRLEIRQIIGDGTSRFSKEIKEGAIFTCSRERNSILGGLWQLTKPFSSSLLTE